MAELLAVAQGLRIAWQYGCRRIVCESDCLNVIESLRKNKSVNLHSCAILLTEVRCMLLEDWEVVFQHVLRDNNTVADLLAKLGLKEKWDLTVWDSPPPEVAQLRELG
ncbi:uncharacterized protein LOC130722284 [Lotus japonicus]|uniref:uncharacterized protein LOC130722284 n=1 Tax=Lotus japonicus TaxID=34305 RepID=UPI0025902D83|nr:uncharacterized protein LOC130722284 [Lotus japonicus]